MHIKVNVIPEADFYLAFKIGLCRISTRNKGYSIRKQNMTLQMFSLKIGLCFLSCNWSIAILFLWI